MPHLVSLSLLVPTQPLPLDSLLELWAESPKDIPKPHPGVPHHQQLGTLPQEDIPPGAPLQDPLVCHPE